MTSRRPNTKRIELIQHDEGESEAEHLIASNNNTIQKCSGKEGQQKSNEKYDDSSILSTPHCNIYIASILLLSFMANMMLMIIVLVLLRKTAPPTENVVTGLRSSYITETVKQNITRYKAIEGAKTSDEDAFKASKNVMYGLVHMAKTAGSEINGELANHFERVCGNKGYSYDAFQTNKRFSESGSMLAKGRMNDVVSKYYGGKVNRGKVPFSLMKEIGFEDCDYISVEKPYPFWLTLSDWDLHLHVPCRDPLEHLMSQCNHKSKKFDCQAKQLGKEISKCFQGGSRFSDTLEKQSNISVKCFDPVPPGSYVQYMSSKLQRKKMESEYVHRDTNKPRNRDQECIWNNPKVASAVRKKMVKKYSYYEFCHRCMGSRNEIVLK